MISPESTGPLDVINHTATRRLRVRGGMLSVRSVHTPSGMLTPFFMGRSADRIGADAADLGYGDRLRYRFRIVVVPFRLAEKKYVFMRLCRPVGHTLRHRVWLRPDDIGAQIPAVRLKRKRHAPGDADEVFRFQSL